MKIFNKSQVRDMINQAKLDAINEVKHICLNAVRDELNNLVITRDYKDMANLQQRIETLEIDLLSKDKLINASNPKNTYNRRKVFKNFNGKVK